MKISRLLLLPAVALVVVAAGCGSGTPDVPANAVAVVDGKSVTKSTLDELLDRTKAAWKGTSRTFPKAGTTEYLSLQQEAVAYLVSLEEYEQEAAALGVRVTGKQVEERLDEIKKQFGSEKAYLAGIKQRGYTPASLREDTRVKLVTEGLYEALTKGVKVSDAEARTYYEENKQTYTTPQSRDVRHILLKSRAVADDVLRQLRGGADFAALAKRYSQDQGTKASGGRYTVSKGLTVPPFEKAAFSLDTNELSQPVKTQFGWHIIQPTGDLKKAAVAPFAKVKDTIVPQLLETKRGEVASKWVADLREKYEGKVAYAEGYAPPAVATTPTTTADES